MEHLSFAERFTAPNAYLRTRNDPSTSSVSHRQSRWIPDLSSAPGSTDRMSGKVEKGGQVSGASSKCAQSASRNRLSREPPAAPRTQAIYSPVGRPQCAVPAGSHRDYRRSGAGCPQLSSPQHPRPPRSRRDSRIGDWHQPSRPGGEEHSLAHRSAQGASPASGRILQHNTAWSNRMRSVLRKRMPRLGAVFALQILRPWPPVVGADRRRRVA
jgi:hypothetical protein